MRFLVFDVESVGLHGEGFAVGAVEIDEGGGVVAEHRFSCPATRALTGYPSEDKRHLAWIREHVPGERAGDASNYHNCRSSCEVRDRFWAVWQEFCATGGGYLAADVPWPVEARFLSECVDDDLVRRNWKGPYPLIDIASVRLAAGLDPLGTCERLPDEQPEHDPLCDARQSARLLLEAFQRLDVEALGILEPPSTAVLGGPLLEEGRTR
jgi:hypothetical protein